MPRTLVVHLDGCGPHVMADAGALDPGAEVVAQLVFVVAVELAAEEGGYVFGLHGLDGHTRDRFVQGSEVPLAPEHDVRRVLGLHQAPVVARFEAECADDGAVALGKSIQSMVQRSDRERVGDQLCRLEVVELHECVVEQLVADASLVELSCQPAVAVEVELQPEGAPGRHSQVAEAKLFVDEVEVVVQALAGGRFEEGLVGPLVVPRPVARAGLHRGQDVNEPRVVTAALEHLLDQCFLAGLALAHKLDLDTGLLGEPLGVVAHLIPERLSEEWVVEDVDIVRPQVRGHAVGVTQAWQSSRDDHPVPARQHSGDLVLVAIDQ